MSKNPVLNALTLPFRLPGIIAEKVTPKTDLLASDKSLDRRSGWGYGGSVFFGCTAVLGFAGACILAVGCAIGAVGLTGAAAAVAAGFFGGGYVAATVSAVCNKLYIDSTVIKVLNAAVKEMTAKASLEEINAAFSPNAPAPEFNHAAATTLDKDLRAMPTIKLAPKQGAASCLNS